MSMFYQLGLISVAILATSHAFPEVLLRNVPAPSNSTYVAVTRIGSDNQQCLPDAIKAAEICVKHGIWIFYPEPGYVSTGPNSTWIFTRDPADLAMTCYPLPIGLSKAVGSFRLAGDLDDENLPALNAYVDLYYGATELFTNHSLVEVPFAFNSIIITGSSQWQFYMKEGFEGLSECSRVGETYIPDFQDRFGVQAGDIKSIRIDCDKRAGRLNPYHVRKGYNIQANNMRSFYG